MSPLGIEEELDRLIRGKKTVLLCVGNQLRGDDGAAAFLAEELSGKTVRLKVLDCSTNPQESLDGVLALEPQVLVFVDAIDRSLKPGSVVLEELHSNPPLVSSLLTHKFPLAWVAHLAGMLGREEGLNINSFLVGIQVSSTEGEMSTPVRDSINKLLKVLQRLDSSAATFNA